MVERDLDEIYTTARLNTSLHEILRVTRHWYEVWLLGRHSFRPTVASVALTRCLFDGVDIADDAIDQADIVTEIEMRRINSHDNKMDVFKAIPPQLVWDVSIQPRFK